MALIELPDELVLLVFNHLDTERDMSSLSQVNRRFYNLLDPSLYHYNATYSNSSALRFGAKHGPLSTVKKAIEGGADHHLDDRTALSYAAEAGQYQICEFLLNYRPDHLETRAESSGFTPLCYAAARGHASTVNVLLSHGANADIRDHWGRSPLLLTCTSGHTAAADLLSASDLLSTSNLHLDRAEGSDRISPLLEAIKWGHEPIVRLLLAKGADPCFQRRSNRVRPPSQESPLHLAIEKQKPEILRLLLNWTAMEGEPNVLDRNASDCHSNTPLLQAAQYNNEELVEVLLSDPQVDLVDLDRKAFRVGRTALLEAELKRNEKMVTLLLEAGADPDIPDIMGLTPRMLQDAETGEIRGEILERHSLWKLNPMP